MQLSQAVLVGSLKIQLTFRRLHSQQFFVPLRTLRRFVGTSILGLTSRCIADGGRWCFGRSEPKVVEVSDKGPLSSTIGSCNAYVCPSLEMV